MAAMSSTTTAVRRSLRSRLGACCLVTLLGAFAAPSAAHPVSAACGTRDAQILTVMEEHGERQDIPADRLALAAFAMQVARDACRQGRTEVGMAIYDIIHPQVILVPSSLR